jgi:hypothetical protein
MNDFTFAEIAEVSLDDFYAYMPQHSYIYIHTREMWPAVSVNARLPPVKVGEGKSIKASTWPDQNRPVEQMTWAPGKPMVIRDRLIDDGGWLDHPGATVFNLYRPPTIVPGDRTQVGRWLDHIKFINPDDWERIVQYCAHLRQRPDDKINHALVLGGKQGIGKDTILAPVKIALGEWNCHAISPQELLGRFNPFVKSVMTIITEARDLGELNRFAFYEHSKAYTASPPNFLLCDEKHLRQHYVVNVMGFIVTSNNTNALYLPPDDRRHDVAWSKITKENEKFKDDYWIEFYAWYEREGYANVAAYLQQYDLSKFDPKAPPVKTQAFWTMVDANRAPEDSELADVIDRLKKPPALTIAMLVEESKNDMSDLYEWLTNKKNRRNIPYRLESVGYVPVRNDSANDGLWVIDGRRMAVYAKFDLSLREQIEAAQALLVKEEPKPQEPAKVARFLSPRAEEEWEETK